MKHILILSIVLALIDVVNSFTIKKIPDKITVHVINLDSKKEKYKKIVNLWSEHFNLIRFSAKKAEDGVCGLSLSHIALMREFLLQDEEDYLLLMEDDAVPTPEFTPEFVHTALEHAMRVPFWHVINFGPWFSKQPKVEPIDDYLVTIDYFHTTHFMGYHRRGVEKYLENFASVIEKGYCLAVDNFFGNYGTAKSQSNIIAASKLMAYQVHGGKSDIGGGPEMVPCAINAALAGRRVYVHINEAPKYDIRPTFDPPVYGYKVIDSPTGEIIWSLQCNLAGDEITQAQVDPTPQEIPKVKPNTERFVDEQKRLNRESSGDNDDEEASSTSKKKKSKKKKGKKSKKALDEYEASL